MKKNKFQKIAEISLLTNFSLIFTTYLIIPVPLLPFLKLDLCDFPIYYVLLRFGLKSSFIVLILVSFLKSFFLGSTGWIGFIMRISSIFIILILNLLLKIKKNIFFYYIFLFLGILLSTLFKNYLSFIFLLNLNILSKNMINDIYYLSFFVNLIKNLLNLYLAEKLYRKKYIYI